MRLINNDSPISFARYGEGQAYLITKGETYFEEVDIAYIVLVCQTPYNMQVVLDEEEARQFSCIKGNPNCECIRNGKIIGVELENVLENANINNNNNDDNNDNDKSLSSADLVKKSELQKELIQPKKQSKNKKSK